MKKILIVFVTLFSIVSYAQNIENTLSATGDFLVKDAINTFFRVKQASGLIGIGNNVVTPRAQLEVGGLEGLLVTGTYNAGIVRALGAGSRLHWYPRRGAFRVGYAESAYWDDNGAANSNLGIYSIGMGYMPRATATHSVAIGAYNKATADYSLALGAYSIASGSHAIAIGTQVYASGTYSIALGAGADTNNKDGAVVIGDDTYFQTAYAAADNQLTMRFNGGYRLWTSYPDSTAGVYMRHGQSGWSNYCDRNMKENFESVDGEWILSKIKNIPITKWNYKKTDVNEKYIGPVAQDFYEAFQLNGTDSLGINSISIDGINLAGVQALEKRTSDLIQTYDTLIKENQKIIEDNLKLKAELKQLVSLKDELIKIKSLREEMKEYLGKVKNKISNDGNVFAKITDVK